MDSPTVQKIVDILAHNGHLTVPVLNILRTTSIGSIHLTASMVDADGLNLAGRDVLKVFRIPKSFLRLTELHMSDAPLGDFDLVNIHHLPALKTLTLDNTGIGNEAVYLLVSLKNTLAHLSLCANPHIDDDAVSALLLLTELSFLSILDTGIGMVGLRKLAVTIKSERREIDIEIPASCETYIDNMQSKYLINPSPPLIKSPSACATLSVAALKRNLLAHAEYNADIVANGTKNGMAERLRTILQTRKMDIVVRKMIWHDESEREVAARL
ncbi:hypothetical protein PLICRDRAFT_362655 [Plicaturopsis crispa FD-325 SS-3]|uniref:Unplaced genomic scaffold PLICRscaffold_18, whole genome shotgun sequence n=1 Tax=Plicaturopsis crispa FD-325 SS-3 TaxID=944288 RepID=A0A0C9SKV0_PLICR|nr:hypothetical protein PLICRDRAFT_362655 [Plicaturopsis crispa FD-325 SS-3]